MAHYSIGSDPAQPDIFLGRLPARPYCTRDGGRLSRGLTIRPAATARTRPHIQVNPPWMRSFMVFDVDRADGHRHWEDVGLPPPWWNSINPANGHSHTCYALNAPVLLGERNRERPMRYLVAVESALRDRIHGDPSYGGLVTKNPTHSAWRTLRGGRPMSLGEIAAHLPNLNKHKPRRRANQVGVGRNCDTYDWLRPVAYRAARNFWGEQGGFVHYLAHLHHQACDYTGVEHRVPLDHRECHHIAKSVARWTWARFTPETWSERQAALGRRSGASRRRRTEQRDAVIRFMHRDCGLPQRTLARRFGLSASTVNHVVGRPDRGVFDEPYAGISPRARISPANAAGIPDAGRAR